VFRQSIPRIGLSIEQGTPSVPDDGQYYVLLEGEQVFSSLSDKEALDEYRRLRHSLLGMDGQEAPDRRSNIREAIHKEAADRQARTFLAESARRKRAKALRKGGPGGSGGVGG
jgi:hypothetical protein